VTFYTDLNGDGIVDGADAALGSATYASDNGIALISFNNPLPAFATQNYLVVYNFSPTAPSGTYQASVVGSLDLTGSNTTTGQTISFSGVPVNGATITIAAATATPTFTVTATVTAKATSTLSFTPTAGNEIVLGGPYPNPSQGGPVNVDIETTGQSSVRWSVFTLSFRKIVGGELSVNGEGKIQWDLLDRMGSPVADGLYYLKVEVNGPQDMVKVLKVLVVR
jgi:hypothetical protein